MANINWDFIFNKEGGLKTVGYVPDGSDKSGTTVANAFDLGQQTKESIKNFGFKDQNILNIVEPYLNIQGEEARKIAPTLQLTNEQAQDISDTVRNYYENNIQKQYNARRKNISFEQLDPAVQTAVASVGYQYGDLRRTPKFFEAALNNDVPSLVNELKNFNDNFPTRRNAEADYVVDNIQDINLKKNKLSVLNILDPTAIADGELYIDTLFKTYQTKNVETKSLLEGFGIAANLNHIAFNIYRALRVPAFEPDPTFSFNEKAEEIKKILDENNIDPIYYDYLIPSVSMPHFLSLVDRVKYEQEQRAELQKLVSAHIQGVFNRVRGERSNQGLRATLATSTRTRSALGTFIRLLFCRRYA